MEIKAGRLKISAEVQMATLLAVLLFSPAPALSQAPFYQGKTVTIGAGTKAGDVYNM